MLTVAWFKFRNTVTEEGFDEFTSVPLKLFWNARGSLKCVGVVAARYLIVLSGALFILRSGNDHYRRLLRSSRYLVHCFAIKRSFRNFSSMGGSAFVGVPQPLSNGTDCLWPTSSRNLVRINENSIPSDEQPVPLQTKRYDSTCCLCSPYGEEHALLRGGRKTSWKYVLRREPEK